PADGALLTGPRGAWQGRRRDHPPVGGPLPVGGTCRWRALPVAGRLVSRRERPRARNGSGTAAPPSGSVTRWRPCRTGAVGRRGGGGAGRRGSALRVSAGGGTGL